MRCSINLATRGRVNTAVACPCACGPATTAASALPLTASRRRSPSVNLGRLPSSWHFRISFSVFKYSITLADVGPTSQRGSQETNGWAGKNSSLLPSCRPPTPQEFFRPHRSSFGTPRARSRTLFSLKIYRVTAMVAHKPQPVPCPLNRQRQKLAPSMGPPAGSRAAPRHDSLHQG